VPTLAAVLDLIRERTTVSRVELAEATGLTQTTMTNAVRKLITMGLVHEVGMSRSGRGSPRRLLELRPEAGYMFGIQLDLFAAVGVVIDVAGRIVRSARSPPPRGAGTGAVVAAFAESVRPCWTRAYRGSMQPVRDRLALASFAAVAVLARRCGSARQRWCCWRSWRRCGSASRAGGRWRARCCSAC
jgi:DNA-binding transcriptional ArsR family regulator